LLPRIAFKKKFQNQNGQEFFDMQRIDCAGIHPSYYQYMKDEVVKDFKEEMLYVSEEVVDERNLETLRSMQYELPDG